MKANFGISKENKKREKNQPRNLMENHFYKI